MNGRRRSTNRPWVLAAIACLAASAGCGDSGPDLVPLTGTVTVGGRPLERGMVQLVPEDPRGSAAVGSVAAGRFVALTADRPGVVPGRYRIRIDARAEPKDETDTLPKPLVPLRYFDAATSGLSCEAIAGRDNAVELNLP